MDSTTNQLVFQWDAFDHLPAIDDLDPLIDHTRETVDWTHGNAIEVTADGNYLMSFRNLSQVVKIDSRSGAPVEPAAARTARNHLSLVQD